MPIDLTNLKARAQQSRKKHKRLYKRLERRKGSEVDALFREADGEAFSRELVVEEKATELSYNSAYALGQPLEGETQSGHDWRFLDPAVTCSRS